MVVKLKKIMAEENIMQEIKPETTAEGGLQEGAPGARNDTEVARKFSKPEVLSFLNVRIELLSG